jgi:hypothetical protein
LLQVLVVSSEYLRLVMLIVLVMDCNIIHLIF